MDDEYLYRDYAHHLSSAVIRGETVIKYVNVTFGGKSLKKEAYIAIE